MLGLQKDRYREARPCRDHIRLLVVDTYCHIEVVSFCNSNCALEAKGNGV
jgi:hypothetical protein